jgi:ribokinase
MKRIRNLGSINVDFVYRVPHFVRPGETLASYSLMRSAGGKGFNQSLALARAKAEVSHLGRYGQDAADLRDALAAENVDVRHLLATSTPAGHAIIQVDDQGQNAILLYAGANHALMPADVPSLLCDSQPGDWFLTQNETSCVGEALVEAQERGLVVCFNPAPITGAVEHYPLEGIDWLIFNETEGAALAGATDPKDILQRLRVRCPKAHLVLTLGAEGALCLTPDGKLIETKAPRVKPIDTTGAGDVFIGYLLAEILRGAELKPALDLACHAAALSVTREGASIPHLSEVHE